MLGADGTSLGAVTVEVDGASPGRVMTLGFAPGLGDVWHHSWYTGSIAPGDTIPAPV
jgi:hypothetical protein